MRKRRVPSPDATPYRSSKEDDDHAAEWDRGLPQSERDRQNGLEPGDIEPPSERSEPRRPYVSLLERFPIDPEEEKREQLAANAIKILRGKDGVRKLLQHQEELTTLRTLLQRPRNFTDSRTLAFETFEALETHCMYRKKLMGPVPTDPAERVLFDGDLKEALQETAESLGLGLTEHDLDRYWNDLQVKTRKLF